MKVGDLVASISQEYVLHSGSDWYPYAVVIQESPLVLTSYESDMRWESTIQADKLRVVGKVNKRVLKRCMRRLAG